MGPENHLGVFNNGVRAVERALLERYFLCKVGNAFERPLPVTGFAYNSTCLQQFQRRVVRLVRDQVRVLDLREVVLCYTGPKRRVYERAYASLGRECLNRKDSALRPFTKFEKQDLSKAPRIINPRHPRYNLTLGRYLKKAEKPFFSAINDVWGSCTGHTVIKGLNVVEVGGVMRQKWERFSDPVAVGLDAVKFDMHVSVPALRYEHAFYNKVFCAAELKRLLTQQLVNRGMAVCPDGTVKFRIPGTRSSGDLNTSLGNCIIMCALIWAYCRERGVVAELANNGDDCVVIMEKSALCEFERGIGEWFVVQGFRMAVETPVYEFEQIEFCQSFPMWDGVGWRMVRNPVTCLKKDPMCLLPLTGEKSFRKWLWAVGNCGLALVPGIPVMASFYACFARHGLKASDRHVAHMFRGTSMLERAGGLVVERRLPDSNSRASFWRATGLTPDYQIALERYFDRLVIDTRLRSIVEDVRISPPFLWHL